MQTQIINYFVITVSWIAFVLFITSICFEIYTRNSVLFNKIGHIIWKLPLLIGKLIGIIFDCLVRLITSPLTAALYLLGTLLDIIYLFKDITRYQTIKKWITAGFYEYDIFDYEYESWYRVRESLQPRLEGIWYRYLEWLHNEDFRWKNIPNYRMWFLVAYLCRVVWYACYLGVYYILHITKYGLCKLCKAQMAELVFFSVYFIIQTLKVEVGLPLHKLVWAVYTFCKQQLYYITPNFLIAHIAIAFNWKIFEWYWDGNLEASSESPEHVEMRDNYFGVHWAKTKPIESEFVTNGLGAYVIVYSKYLWIHLLLLFIYIPIWVFLIVAEFVCKQLIGFTNLGILLYQYLLRKQYKIIKLILVLETITAKRIVNQFVQLVAIILKVLVTLVTFITSNQLVPYILLFPIVIAYYFFYYIINILLHIPGLLSLWFMWSIKFTINHRLFLLILCAVYWIDLRVILEIGYVLSENLQSLIISFKIGEFFSNFMLMPNVRMEWSSNMIKYVYPWASVTPRISLHSPNIGFRNYPEDMIGLLSWYVDPEQWCDAWNWDNPPYYWRYEEFGEHPPRPDFFWRKQLFDECYPFEACFHRYHNRHHKVKMLHHLYCRNFKTINWPGSLRYGGVTTASVNDWYINDFVRTLESAQGLYRHLYSQHSFKGIRYSLYARNWRTHLFLLKQKPLAWFSLKLDAIRLQILNRIVMTYTYYWLLYASYNQFYAVALALACLQKILIILPYKLLYTVNYKVNETFPLLKSFKSFVWESVKFCWLSLLLPALSFCFSKLNINVNFSPFNSFSIRLIVDYLTIIVSALITLINHYITTSWLKIIVNYLCIDEYLKLISTQLKYYRWLFLMTIHFHMPAFKDFYDILLKPVIFYDRYVVFTQIVHQYCVGCWDYIWCLLVTIIETFVARPETTSIQRHTVSKELQYNHGENYHYMMLNQVSEMLLKYEYPVLGTPTYFQNFFNKWKFYAIGRNISVNKALFHDLKVTDSSGEYWSHLNQSYTQLQSRYLNFYYYLLHNRKSNKYFIMYDQDNISNFNFKRYNEILASQKTKTVYYKSIYWTALYSIKLAFAPLLFVTKTPSAFYKSKLPLNLNFEDIITVEVSHYSKLLLNTEVLSPLLLPLVVIIKLQLFLDSWSLYLQVPRRQQKLRQRFTIRNWLNVGRTLWIQPVRRTQMFNLQRWKPTNTELVDNFLHFTSLKEFDHLMPLINTCNDSLMLCNWEPGSVVSWFDDTSIHRVETYQWWSLNYKLLYSLSVWSIFLYFITLILLCLCSNSFVYLICSDERQFKQRMLFSRQYNWNVYRTKGPAERVWLEFTRDQKENSIFTKNVKLTNDIKVKLSDYELTLQQYLKYNSEHSLRSTFSKMYKKSVCKFVPEEENKIFISPTLNQYHLDKRYEIYARNEHAHAGNATYSQFIAYAYNKDPHINETWQEPEEEEYEHIHDDYLHDQAEVDYYLFKQDEKLYNNLFNLDKHFFNMQLPVWVWHKDALNLRWYDIKDPYTKLAGKGLDTGMSGRYIIENDDDQGYVPFGILTWFCVMPLLLVIKPFLFLSGYWTHYVKNPFNISHHLAKYTSSILNHLESYHNILQWSTLHHPAYKRAGSLGGRTTRRGYIFRPEHVTGRNFYHAGAGLLDNYMGARWSLFAPQTILFASKEGIRLFYYFNICMFVVSFLYLARRNSKERKLSIRKLNSNVNTHFVAKLITTKALLKNAYLWFWR